MIKIMVVDNENSKIDEEVDIKPMTVGELKKKMNNIPDDAIVELQSDLGINSSNIIIEDAYHKNNKYESLVIYANCHEE